MCFGYWWGRGFGDVKHELFKPIIMTHDQGAFAFIRQVADHIQNHTFVRMIQAWLVNNIPLFQSHGPPSTLGGARSAFCRRTDAKIGNAFLRDKPFANLTGIPLAT